MLPFLLVMAVALLPLRADLVAGEAAAAAVSESTLADQVVPSRLLVLPALLLLPVLLLPVTLPLSFAQSTGLVPFVPLQHMVAPWA